MEEQGHNGSSDLTTAEIGLRELTASLDAVLGEQANGSPERGADLLTELCEKIGGDVSVYLLAKYVASTYSESNIDGFRVVDTQTGRPLNPDGLPSQDHKDWLWCHRLVTASANRDIDQVRALLETLPIERVSFAIGRMLEIAGARMREDVAQTGTRLKARRNRARRLAEVIQCGAEDWGRMGFEQAEENK